MADVYEQNLASKSTLTTTDYIRVVGSDNVSYKQLVSDVAKKIIESYTGSTLAGSAQSVKSALDSLNSKTINASPGLSAEGFISLETGWSLSIARYTVYGNIISLEVLITPPSAIESGSLVKIGTVKSGYRPTAMTPLGGGSLIGYIWNDGDFRVRNITANSISNQQRIGLIYLKA